MCNAAFCASGSRENDNSWRNAKLDKNVGSLKQKWKSRLGKKM